MKTTNKAAYLRGQRFAIQWKRLVRTLRQWDNFWVHAARKRHLPTWTGRLPLALGLTGIVVCALFSITAVLGCLAFIWAVAYILRCVGAGFNTQCDSLEKRHDLNFEYEGEQWKRPIWREEWERPIWREQWERDGN
ncbi:hypothetical protein EGX65_24195 [Escherichia coli]|uniref:hypothetical protein n=1 Tax=Escherichia coli TaxID=562 RepID=UPI0003900846|nr:hypothetical protein [Escherichia coli]EBY9023615.1 hypothetical protein [Salmonella enterica subsp. enterica serovar Typhimurium]EEW0764192.1 hypothetical protein [Escherichia albertii]EQW65655.1 hypothetical protein G909_02955 [Escherichia coli UMEA 3113-1]KNQ80011.1 hypothetical protein AEW06_20160 [Salmonella enterica subsp. enterica serovar Derby]ECD4349246.1 hypothetical protein [Salmonella enterica subsp. enterica serovar Typhimurium]